MCSEWIGYSPLAVIDVLPVCHTFFIAWHTVQELYIYKLTYNINIKLTTHRLRNSAIYNSVIMIQHSYMKFLPVWFHLTLAFERDTGGSAFKPNPWGKLTDITENHGLHFCCNQCCTFFKFCHLDLPKGNLFMLRSVCVSKPIGRRNHKLSHCSWTGVLSRSYKSKSYSKTTLIDFLIPGMR